jgi:hypothetical protein
MATLPTAADVIAAVRARGNDAKDLRDASHEACHAIEAGIATGWKRDAIHSALSAKVGDTRAGLWVAEMRARAVEQIVCERLGVDPGMALDDAVGLAIMESLHFGLPWAEHDVSVSLARRQMTDPTTLRIVEQILALPGQPMSAPAKRPAAKRRPRAATRPRRSHP